MWPSEHTKATNLVSRIWREGINSLHKCKLCGKTFSFPEYFQENVHNMGNPSIILFHIISLKDLSLKR
jgi:hypothetical protein